MLTATLIAIFLIPMLFVVVERLASRRPARQSTGVTPAADPSRP